MVLGAQGPVLSPERRRAAVLGSPIAHSLSPALHTAAYRALGLTGWRYDAHEVTAAGLPGFVAGLDREWAGLSLTMPLKEVAFEVAAECSPLAVEVGAVNTLVRRADGAWAAHNTDVYGVRQALRGAGLDTAARAVVLGSGATARSVVAALADLGVAEVAFAVRAQARPETLAQARARGMGVEVCPLDAVAAALRGADVVVSTLPRDGGSQAAAALAAAVDEVPTGRPPLVLDVVYAGWPTPLAQAFGERGSRVVSGLEMLLHQAAEQVRLMTGLEPPVAVMRAAGEAAMASR